MQIGEWFNAYLEAEYRILIEKQQKAANRKLRYAIQKQYPPTLLDQQERTMNDMKPFFKLISYIAIIAAVGIAVYLYAGQAFTLPLGLLSIVLALTALWTQSESK